jgi:probable phosphoglycerate mutase
MRGLVCGLGWDEMGQLPNEQGCIYVLENGTETVLRETV